MKPEERDRVDRPLGHHRRDDPAQADRCGHRVRPPVAAGRVIDHPPTTGRSAVRPLHADPHATLVKEDQPTGVGPLHTADPTLAFNPDIVSALLASNDFF